MRITPNTANPGGEPEAPLSGKGRRTERGFTRLDNETEVAYLMSLPTGLVKAALLLMQRRHMRNPVVTVDMVMESCGVSRRRAYQVMSALGCAISCTGGWVFSAENCTDQCNKLHKTVQKVAQRPAEKPVQVGQNRAPKLSRKEEERRKEERGVHIHHVMGEPGSRPHAPPKPEEPRRTPPTPPPQIERPLPGPVPSSTLRFSGVGETYPAPPVVQARALFRQSVEAEEAVYAALGTALTVKFRELSDISGRRGRAWQGWVREQVYPHLERLGAGFQPAAAGAIRAFHGSTNPQRWGLQDFVRCLEQYRPAAAPSARSGEEMTAADYLRMFDEEEANRVRPTA